MIDAYSDLLTGKDRNGCVKKIESDKKSSRGSGSDRGLKESEKGSRGDRRGFGGFGVAGIIGEGAGGIGKVEIIVHSHSTSGKTWCLRKKEQEIWEDFGGCNLLTRPHRKLPTGEQGSRAGGPEEKREEEGEEEEDCWSSEEESTRRRGKLCRPWACAMEVFSMLKHSMGADGVNPITKHFSLTRQTGSAGTEMVWKIYDAVRLEDKKVRLNNGHGQNTLKYSSFSLFLILIS